MLKSWQMVYTIFLKYGTQSTNNSRESENKASLWMGSLGCCWGCGNVRWIDVSNEEHWAPLIHWGWEQAVKNYQASQRPAFSPVQHEWARYCSSSFLSCCISSGKVWRRRTRANTLLMPPCEAFRFVWCDNCWLEEAKLLHKPWLMTLHVCVCFSLLSVLPLVLLLWPSVWCPPCEHGLPVKRFLPVFLCHFASSGARL